MLRVPRDLKTRYVYILHVHVHTCWQVLCIHYKCVYLRMFYGPIYPQSKFMSPPRVGLRLGFCFWPSAGLFLSVRAEGEPNGNRSSMLRYEGRLLSGIPTRCCKCIRYTHTGVSLDIIRYPTSNELRCACRGQAERFDKIERSWSLQGNERHVLVSVLCTFRKQVRCFDGVQCTSFGTTSNCAITARSWSVPLGWPIATDQNAEGSRDAFHKCSHAAAFGGVGAFGGLGASTSWRRKLCGSKRQPRSDCAFRINC